MEFNKFDNEYYVLSNDGANNHPLLAWGAVDFSPFLKAKPIDEENFNFPLQLIFDEPYPIKYEMADFHMLATCYTVSQKFKDFLEKEITYGIQFVPIEIKSNTGEIIPNYFVSHFWNRLPAIDKNNYDGSPVNNFGTIRNLSKFSLDFNLLKEIPLEKRLIFGLAENKTLVLVHQSIYEAIQTENLTGMRFWKVSEWDDNAMFR